MARAETLVYSNANTTRELRPAAQLAVNSRETKIFLIVCIVHLPLGLVLYNIGVAAIIHPVVVMLIGTYWALSKRFSIERVAIAAGYLIGCEVLWRMAQIPVFWEIGKYGTAMLMVLALIRRQRFQIPELALVYLFALIPACLLTFIEFDLEDSRGILSSNMSGPLLLLVSCWFFSHVRVTAVGIRKLIFAVIIPIISVAGVTLFYTVTIENIQFGGESNLTTSGGFGPNQVSAMLGLGVFLACGSIVLFLNSSTKSKIFLGLIGGFLATQSLMTFSRSGMYNALGGLLILVAFNFRNVTDGLKRLVPLAALFALFLWLVFPMLDNFTGGKLQERFEDTGTTNRAELLEADIEVFLQNPVFGVGVGLARRHRKELADINGVTHTEFSRLLSEHGLFGLVAIVALCGMVVTNVKRYRSTLGRALIAGSAVWSILFMFNAGMRLGAPAFFFGLGFISIVGLGQTRGAFNKRKREVLTATPLSGPSPL